MCGQKEGPTHSVRKHPSPTYHKEPCSKKRGVTLDALCVAVLIITKKTQLQTEMVKVIVIKVVVLQVIGLLQCQRHG